MEDGHIDNIFLNSAKGSEAYTLSVYNRADSFRRPVTAPTLNNWMGAYEK